ncbi:hypothetical protein HCG69_02755 [Bacteroides sp. K03]|uniref:hypothetical protein n=2 Tax=Bacteroides TaxID=816 RepID=UPI001C8B6429|nr:MULTISPECIES: hypothetical protein [Bacteroides]MBX9187009.1 hypothetical protein [Bacteroides sp. K03]
MGYKVSYMWKGLNNSDITRCVAIFLFCLLSSKGMSQTGEETVNTLVGMGFENVGWHEDDKERVYVMENTAYRLNGVGIGKAVDVVQRMGLPQNKPCRLIFLDNNVPQISLYYQPTITDSISEADRKDWEVSYDLGKNWRKQVKGKKLNSSLFKVDITVYPELSLKNLVITQIYQVLFNLSPAIEVSFWKGMKLTAQMVIPVYNDGYGSRAGKVHPGFLTLQQTVRLPYNIWGTLAVGTFNAGRYGADLKLFHPFKDERFSVEGRIGTTGTYYWDGFEYVYGSKQRLTWSIGGSFYWPQFNLQTTVKAEQYILGERGVRVDVTRHFRYTSIGFFAMKAEGVRANGGFRFQIALPPYKYKRKGYIPRVTPSKNMGIAYNAGNERYYYKGYRSSPDDNIMNNNSFNPYFIKSELLNF